MRITEIKITVRRVVGDFEFNEVTMIAELEHGDDPVVKRKQLTEMCLADTELEMSDPLPAELEEIDAEILAEEIEEIKEEIKEDPVVKKKAKKTKVKKVVTTPYNRESDQHKALFFSLLVDINKDWKKSKAKEAKAASLSLNGADFLDAEGDILEAFKESVERLLK